MIIKKSCKITTFPFHVKVKVTKIAHLAIQCARNGLFVQQLIGYNMT